MQIANNAHLDLIKVNAVHAKIIIIFTKEIVLNSRNVIRIMVFMLTDKSVRIVMQNVKNVRERERTNVRLVLKVIFFIKINAS